MKNKYVCNICDRKFHKKKIYQNHLRECQKSRSVTASTANGSGDRTNAINSSENGRSASSSEVGICGLEVNCPKAQESLEDEPQESSVTSPPAPCTPSSLDSGSSSFESVFTPSENSRSPMRILASETPLSPSEFMKLRPQFFQEEIDEHSVNSLATPPQSPTLHLPKSSNTLTKSVCESRSPVTKKSISPRLTCKLAGKNTLSPTKYRSRGTQVKKFDLLRLSTNHASISELASDRHPEHQNGGSSSETKIPQLVVKDASDDNDDDNREDGSSTDVSEVSHRSRSPQRSTGGNRSSSRASTKKNDGGSGTHGTVASSSSSSPTKMAMSESSPSSSENGEI